MVSRSSKNLLPMIRIAITAAAHDAIRPTFAAGRALWPVERQCGQFLVSVDSAVLDV
jgi:hypothetical protein